MLLFFKKSLLSLPNVLIMVHLYITLYLRIHFQRTQSKTASSGTLNPTLSLSRAARLFFSVFLIRLIITLQCSLVRCPLKAKKKKNKPQKWNQSMSHSWRNTLGILPCNRSLPAEAWSGVRTFPQSPDGKYVVSSQATGRAFQQSFKKHSEGIFIQKWT